MKQKDRWITALSDYKRIYRRFTCLLFYIFLILFISASQQFRIFTVTGNYPFQPTSLMGYFLSSQFSLRTCLWFTPTLVLAILALRHIALGAQCNLYVSLDIFAIFQTLYRHGNGGTCLIVSQHFLEIITILYLLTVKLGDNIALPAALTADIPDSFLLRPLPFLHDSY